MKHKTLKLAQVSGVFYYFDMVGFNEIYVHDLKTKKAMFINRTFGTPRFDSKLKETLTFEQFHSFSVGLFTSRLSLGDGLQGGKEDLNPAFNLDLTTIAIGALTLDRDN